MNESEQPIAPPTQDRVIRVFISSTFRDMMRERDLLVKEVFPELRRKCGKRFVTFTEVDLRWGITEAQANEGQVLPLCLAEIERSRPYFIGLLGERYGWIPDTIRPEVIAREPWLQEHVQGRTSVTELEILHGVLNNPQMQRHAFFYFRDPAYVNDPALTDDERGDMVERDIRADVEKYGEAEATRRTEERKAKLAALKQRIRDSKLPLVEPYANPKALAEIVSNQFDQLIDRLYPEDQTPDPLAQERMAHEAHAKNKLFACIDRPAHLAALNAFAEQTEHDGKGLVVTGESGGGKTALLAAWARDWAKSHPEDFLFQHYFGATPDSASPEGFLRRLLGELKSRFSLTDDIPTDPEKLREAVPVWLAQTIDKGRIVLVLDGLNQVQGGEPDRHLFFLPRYFPRHVTVLASALPGPALNALHERGWVEHDLPRTSEVEVGAMVDEYLKIHARTLEPELRHELVTAPGAKNPLFLRTVLEELRQFGSFEQLPQRVRHYLEADNPKDLFRRVLARWQEDFDGKDPEQDNPKHDLVRRALTHLWAARQGLSEPEWLDLLGMPSLTSDIRPLTSDPLPRAFWSPLFLALEPHLSQRAGLFAFGHDFLRQAVEAAFVPSDDLYRAAHLFVADYFEHQPFNSRKAAELPWQLAEAHAWERLHNRLAERVFFTHAWDRNEFEVRTYWAQIEANSTLRMVGAYRPQIEQPEAEADKDYLWNLSLLLGHTGHVEESLRLRSALVEHFRSAGDFGSLQMVLVNQAVILQARWELDAAMALLKQAEQICRESRNLRGLQVTFGNQALILEDCGNLDGAMSLHREAEQICRQLGNDPDGLGRTILRQARILHSQGDVDGAMRLLKDAERSFRESGLTYGLRVCLDNQRCILTERGDTEGALRTLKESEQMCRQLGDLDGLQKTLGQQAWILYQRGDFDVPMPLLKEQERICRRLGSLDGLQNSLGQQALILQAHGDLDKALILANEANEIRQQLASTEKLIHSLADQAAQLARMGRAREGLPLATQAHLLAATHGYAVLAGQLILLLNTLKRDAERQ